MVLAVLVVPSFPSGVRNFRNMENEFPRTVPAGVRMKFWQDLCSGELAEQMICFKVDDVLGPGTLFVTGSTAPQPEKQDAWLVNQFFVLDEIRHASRLTEDVKVWRPFLESNPFRIAKMEYAGRVYYLYLGNAEDFIPAAAMAAYNFDWAHHLIDALVPMSLAFKNFADTTNAEEYLGHNITAVAVLENDEKRPIVAADHNMITCFSSHLQHAEMRLIGHMQDADMRKVCSIADGKKEYPVISVYSSLEPCFQCSGTLLLNGYGCIFYWQTDLDMQLSPGSPSPPLLQMCISHASSKICHRENGGTTICTWYGLFSKLLEHTH